MNDMKKTTLTLILAFSAMQASAQDARGAMNEILDGWTLPMIGAFTLIGAGAGVIHQWDNIIDKENRGTRKDGFIAIGLYVGFAMLIGIVIAAVKSSIAGIDLSI